MDGTARSAVIIGNPNSGSAGDEKYLEGFADTLRDGGLQVEVLNTEHPDHATKLAASADGKLVIAAGGDGTVNEVLNGLTSGSTLGILPLGTANVLARELGIPLDPELACRKILSGSPSKVDIGLATDSEGTTRKFACMAGAGFDADVIREVDPRLKRYLKSLAFPIAALKVYFGKGHPDIRIHDGDEKHTAKFAIIANGQYYGGEFETAEDASLTSGNLQIVLVERIGMLLRPDVLARFLAKEPLDHSTTSFGSQRVYVEAPLNIPEPVPVQIDGEVWGNLPMTFEILAGEVTVVH